MLRQSFVLIFAALLFLPQAFCQEKSSPSDEPEEIAIPFHRTSKGQITVNASLHGRSLELIFDTGAEACLFGKNQFEMANLSNEKRSSSVVLNSVSGPIRVFQVMTDIKLGKLKRLLPVCVQDNEMDTGILGQPFIKGYSCSIDNQAGLIRLRKNGKNMHALPFDSVVVPFKEVGDKIIVSARLNGQVTEMCFDTGAFGVCVSKKQSEKLGLKIPDSLPAQTRGPNGMQVNSWETRADLSLAQISKPSCPVRIIDSEMSFPLLGQNFFGERSYSIDRDRKEIRFAR